MKPLDLKLYKMMIKEVEHPDLRSIIEDIKDSETNLTEFLYLCVPSPQFKTFLPFFLDNQKKYLEEPEGPKSTYARFIHLQSIAVAAYQEVVHQTEPIYTVQDRLVHIFSMQPTHNFLSIALIERGADPLLLNSLGQMALDYAFESKNAEFVRAVIDCADLQKLAYIETQLNKCYRQKKSSVLLDQGFFEKEIQYLQLARSRCEKGELIAHIDDKRDTTARRTILKI